MYVDLEDSLSDIDIIEWIEENVEILHPSDESDTSSDHPSRPLLGLLQGEQGAAMRYAFLGFFCGDGCNYANSVGFNLRSTSFVWLASFLRRCGIESPNLR